jgi:cellulase/cellobiase CelA1
VDNPYAGAKFYVNPEWKAKAAAEPGGRAVSNQPTGVWLDRIAAIEGTSTSQSNGPMGLRDHLDEALAQGGSAPIAAQFVIYNLPGRDCSALASNGELPATQEGLTRYKQEYIDPIAQIMADPKYRSVRIITIIEIDSLPNLVTNLNVQMCATVNSNGYYVEGIRYALEKLHAIPNVYTYVDAAHHGWLGWDTNFGPTAELLRSTVAGTPDGLRSVDGFITNTANYSALVEPYIEVNQQTRQTKWVDWNYYVDELSFAQDFRQELINRGFAANIGMLIDTSRNGWGGPNRPTGPSNATDMNTYVNESRLDRRIHAGNWCNQSGAGLGERPRANPEPGIDAYVWIKPPGESDGSSSYIPNEDGKGFDRMCDPTYTGNERNGNSTTGALPNAPISGAWFSAQFQELVRNAWPPLSGEIPVATPTPVPTPIASNTFVSQHGQLRLAGTQLSDQAGRPVQLKGMSSHWAAWYPQYINEGAIGWLVQNKGMTLFRISMGVEPEGHYLEDPDYNKSLVFQAVDACIQQGIYVIIDWHDHNAHQHANEAEAFFQEMARMYGETPNVLYEVFNEPEQVSYTDTVRPYAQRMVNSIRAIDPDNLILVSTPQWCQRPEDVIANPVSGSNIMYTLHFYAASHGQWLRDSADRAIAQGVPIFVSEWGASDYTGGANGSLDLNAAQEWMDWMNARKLSWAAWNLGDKEETTSILVPGARPDGNWVDSDFKGHGPYVLRNMAQ